MKEGRGATMESPQLVQQGSYTRLSLGEGGRTESCYARRDFLSLRLRSLGEIVRISRVCSIVVAVLLMLIRHETVAAAAPLVSTGANKQTKEI